MTAHIYELGSLWTNKCKHVDKQKSQYFNNVLFGPIFEYIHSHFMIWTFFHKRTMSHHTELIVSHAVFLIPVNLNKLIYFPLSLAH